MPIGSVLVDFKKREEKWTAEKYFFSCWDYYCYLSIYLSVDLYKFLFLNMLIKKLCCRSSKARWGKVFTYCTPSPLPVSSLLLATNFDVSLLQTTNIWPLSWCLSVAGLRLDLRPKSLLLPKYMPNGLCQRRLSLYHYYCITLFRIKYLTLCLRTRSVFLVMDEVYVRCLGGAPRQPAKACDPESN